MTRPVTLPTEAQVDAWPVRLTILTSGCLARQPCGVDGSTNGTYPLAYALLALPNVRVVAYCPEHAAFGTPRATPDCVGGNGHDVLDGAARFESDAGDEWTAGIVRTATIMASYRADVALLLDMSGACGSTVIYDGLRRLGRYQRGPGVAAAAIARAGIPIVSQRDERTLARIFHKLGHSADPWVGDGKDHHERTWFREYFAPPT